MKKSTKIILPALALLVLGTTAAATGTVAWFAANGVVSATGMQVRCATSKNLLIANVNPKEVSGGTWEKDVNYGASVKTVKDTITELSPSSTAPTVLGDNTKTDTSGGKFFYASGAGTIDAVSGAVLKGAKVDIAEQSKNRYVQHEFWLANSATADMAIAISSFKITTTDPDNIVDAAITKSLRVGIVYEDKVADTNWVKIYSVLTGFTAEYQGLIAATNSLNTTVKPYTDGDTSTAVSATVKPTLYSTVIDPENKKMDSMGKIESTTHAVTNETELTWSKLDVYVWYEGQDASCTSNNALTVENLSLELSFQADALPTDQTPSQGQ